MVADIETMVHFGEMPWHQDSTAVESSDLFDIDRFAGKAGPELLSEVSLEKLITVGGIDVPNKAVVRECDNQVLGVVGPRYTPLQNREAFDWFSPWLETETLALHTAGTLGGGKKVWILAQVVQDSIIDIASADDSIAKFILLSNSHDGTTSVRVGFTPIRVVCANTLAWAHKDKSSKLLRVRHSTQLYKNLDKIQEIMSIANQDFEATAEQYRWLATRQINQKDLNSFVKTMLDMKNTPKDKVSTRKKNQLAEIIGKMDEPNQNVKGVSGTWWAAYNAYNEYLGYRGGHNADNRMNSLWFGTNEVENRNALKLAISMAS